MHISRRVMTHCRLMGPEGRLGPARHVSAMLVDSSLRFTVSIMARWHSIAIQRHHEGALSSIFFFAGPATWGATVPAQGYGLGTTLALRSTSVTSNVIGASGDGDMPTAR